MSVPSVEFRTIEEADLPFLRRVYASTRAEEMALVDWTPQEIDDFLSMQFDAQHSYYQEHFGDAEFSIIQVDGNNAGRLYLFRGEDEYRVIDIALLPGYRGLGVGGKIMRDILDQARAAKKRVSIHVERNNRALHLYERLGFTKIQEHGVYYLMEWVSLDQTETVSRLD